MSSDWGVRGREVSTRYTYDRIISNVDGPKAEDFSPRRGTQGSCAGTDHFIMIGLGILARSRFVLFFSSPMFFGTGRGRKVPG
jgi:hypothetical protein